MAGVRSVSTIFLYILLIVAIGFGGLFWFDYMGLVDARKLVDPIFNLVGAKRVETSVPVDSLDLLDQERFKKQKEEMELQLEELDSRRVELELREAEVEQMMDALTEREGALMEREKSFNERQKRYENRRANLRKAAEYYQGMPPEQAVERLLAMADQDVIDLFRTTEELALESETVSIVAYWMSLMPPDRVADLSRKMLKKPED